MQIGQGTQLGGYRVVRKIGEGGMGTVFEGVHERLQKRVAIKTLHEQFARDAAAVARFTREGRAASRIQHPHVIDVSDVGMHDGTPYLVMELLDGESLAELLRRGGPLGVAPIADIALPVADALAAAHAAGIVHRDLKPENIFLARSRSGEVKPMVLDFGISCIEDEVRLTKTAHFMGTPYYMSPEQAQSARSVDARSDQFSLGLVLFELVTGRRALSGSSVLEVVHRVSTEGAIRLTLVRPDLPADFTAVVDRMTERSPSARFASMRDVGAALLPFASPRVVAVWSGAFLGAPTMPSPPSTPITAPIGGLSAYGTRDAPPTAPRSSFSVPAPAASFSSASANRSGPSSLTPIAVSVASFTPSSAPRAPVSAPPRAIATDPTLNARASAAAPAARRDASNAPPPARSPVLLAVVAVAGVLGAVGVAFMVGITLAGRQTGPATEAPSPAVGPPSEPPVVGEPSPPPRSPTIDVRLRAVPATAEIVLDGRHAAYGSYAHSLPRDGIPHVLEVRATGFIPHTIEFVDVAPVAEIVLDPIPSHHHGPIVPRRSAMTEAGLVPAPPPAPIVVVPEPVTPVRPPPEAETPTQPVVAAVVPAPVEEPVPAPPTPPAHDDWERAGPASDDLIPFPSQ